jgi:transposase-like protein
MYPLYWTTSKEGIFMRYSYEFKKKCVEMYRSGVYPDTPEGVSQSCFRSKVRKWFRTEDALGPEALKPKHIHKQWLPGEKYELICQVLAGKSYLEVALYNGVNDTILRNWVRKYKIMGYNGLVETKKGRPQKNPYMKKVNYNKPREIEESEYEELIRLRAENEYIKAEIEVIKKEIALREEKKAALLKAKKQRLSKNSAKKDTN